MLHNSCSSDLNRIEIITEASSLSDLPSTSDSQQQLAAANKIQTTTWCPVELQATNMDLNRVSTPSNMMRRWSLNLTRAHKGKLSLRDKTIYRLPSRKLFEINGKLLSKHNVVDHGAEIAQLMQEIEQHDCLMADTALAKQNRIETLRALPQSLSMKRVLKQQLQQHTTVETTPSCRKRFYNFCMSLMLKCWHLMLAFYHGIEFWYDALKTIEGHFGSNMSSYFKFLRWLFVLNLLMFVCTVSFVTLPQILFDMQHKQQTTQDDVTALTAKQDDWKLLDVLTGEGQLQNSVLFYGGYSNNTIVYGQAQHSYSLPHAYFLTMLLLYLLTFVVISTSMARSYRKSFIETSGSVRSMYTQKIFCSWDFGISNRKSANLKHLIVFTELKELLSEMAEAEAELSFCKRLARCCMKLLAHLLVLSLILGVGAAIWFLLKEFSESVDETPWTTLYVATTVNISLLLLQCIFYWIAKLENNRSPRNALHVTLVRNFLLEAVIIGVLLYFWLTKKYQECWETAVGQEIYRLILTDFFLNLILLPVFCVVRVYLFRFWPKVGYPEFDISQKSLSLVYNQTLFWVGLLFAPLLAVIVPLKMVLTFYVNKIMLLQLCKSPCHIWRSAQTQTLYLVFTFLSLLGVIIAFGYIMTQVPLSTQCGPFRNYAFMFQIFIDGMLKLHQHHIIYRILMTLMRPAAVGVMLTILAVMVYYLRAKSRARGMLVKLLKDMVYLEVKDKEYLLAQITNLTKDREWLFEQADLNETAKSRDELAKESGSWRYQRMNESQINAEARNQSSKCMLRSRKL